KEGRPEWRQYQKEYSELISARSQGGEGLPAALVEGPRIRQVLLEDLERTDRCQTCHIGAADLGMQDQPLPLRAHSGSLLEFHPPARFGCTICHAGQGQAVDQKNAHARAREAHWPSPLLSLDYAQSACGQCHLAIFGDSVFLEGTETFGNGLRVFRQEGCLGCHKARGVGGTIGPDLTVQGEKTRHEYDFSRIAGDRTVSNWLYAHFKDPEMVSPGSQMLAVDLDEDEIQAMITFTLGMAKPDIPFEYFSLETLREFKGQRSLLTGAEAYPLLCSACHGKEGEGKDYEKYETGVPSLGDQDFLSVASEDLIAFTITHGRSGRQMAAWLPRFSGLKAEEIRDLAAHVKSQRVVLSELAAVHSNRGDVQAGRELYLENCALCHGEDGKGAQVITISNADMLAAASDTYLYETITRGRGNTAMPGWGRFSSEELAHILAFLRSWSTVAGRSSLDLGARGDAARGKERYHFLCSRCHGIYGQGDTGPAIQNPDFLAAASDAFLTAMVSYGRRGTAMFGWATAVSLQERLSTQDVADVITFLRQASASRPLEVIYAGSNFGSSERGRALFQNRCVECHGRDGEGTKAPALNSQELINAATNGYLFATISLGRSSTAMPSWGKESGDRPALSVQERQDLVSFIRGWQRVVIKALVKTDK
ncbi:MAG: c-type cytochrome, partial [Candidatus Aminicenantaceae bacterium]